MNEIATKLKNLKQKSLDDTFDTVNQEAQKGWNNIHNPKYKAQLKKALEKFIERWSDPKNNQGSSVILALVKQAQIELKTK